MASSRKFATKGGNRAIGPLEIFENGFIGTKTSYNNFDPSGCGPVKQY